MIWQVWSEGFLLSGQDGVPSAPYLHGEAEAETFCEACDYVFDTPEGKAPGMYDPKRLSWWGCRLFPDEESAARLFGMRGK